MTNTKTQRGRGPRAAGHRNGHQGGGRCCGHARHGGHAGRGALLEPAVVAALLRDGGHGYDLRKTIAEMTDDAIRVDAGGLYRILRRMEADGFVTSAWVAGDAGPRKRDYTLTGEGRELAEDWIEHLQERARLAALLSDELGMALAKAQMAEGSSS